MLCGFYTSEGQESPRDRIKAMPDYGGLLFDRCSLKT